MRYDTRDKTDYSDRTEQLYAHQDFRVKHRLPDGTKPVHPNLAPYYVVQVRTGQPDLPNAEPKLITQTRPQSFASTHGCRRARFLAITARPSAAR